MYSICTYSYTYILLGDTIYEYNIIYTQSRIGGLLRWNPNSGGFSVLTLGNFVVLNRRRLHNILIDVSPN